MRSSASFFLYGGEIYWRVMRYLGIDYGSKRVGIAVSDERGKIAFPRAMVPNGAKVFSLIRAIAAKESAGMIVVGLPVLLNGSESGETRRTRRFAERLKKTVRLPLAFENEMFTTRMARASAVKKEYVDESSAALILQSFLDKSAMSH